MQSFQRLMNFVGVVHVSRPPVMKLLVFFELRELVA